MNDLGDYGDCSDYCDLDTLEGFEAHCKIHAGYQDQSNLHMAIGRGYIALIPKILAYGADPNEFDEDLDMSPLHELLVDLTEPSYVKWLHDIPLAVEALLNHGANPNVSEGFRIELPPIELPPIYFTFISNFNGERYHPIYPENNEQQIILQRIFTLLLDFGATLNCTLPVGVTEIPSWVVKLLNSRNKCRKVAMLTFVLCLRNASLRDLAPLIARHVWTWRYENDSTHVISKKLNCD